MPKRKTKPEREIGDNWVRGVEFLDKVVRQKLTGKMAFY